MEFALPDIGEGVYEAELVRWLVAPGDAVKRGQNLLEVLTDKATMEVPVALRRHHRVALARAGPDVQGRRGDPAPTRPPAQAATDGDAAAAAAE